MASRAATMVKLAQEAIEDGAPAAERYRFMPEEIWGRDSRLRVKIELRAASGEFRAASREFELPMIHMPEKIFVD